MSIVSIVGARPQFIKAAAVSRELRKDHEEFLLHTGQHYDFEMADVFFRELEIPSPDVNLGAGSGSHGAQTAAMLSGIEQILLQQKPERVLVYGDTNSTLAGALAAAKLHVPVAHVEAGLRSFNRAMPEEINRVVTDHVSDVLFCPSQTAVRDLNEEGIRKGVHLIGDVMLDVLTWGQQRVHEESSDLLAGLSLRRGGYLLATVHRAENTDNAERLEGIMGALAGLGEPVVLPIHPRTRRAMAGSEQLSSLDSSRGSLRLVEPVGYLDMVRLMQSARLILTDSGGIQKEAYWLRVPCITLRDETEWVETVEAGWNVLVGADAERITEAVRAFTPRQTHPSLYGDGAAAAGIRTILSEAMLQR